MNRQRPMGPLPAVAGCDCRICRSGDHYDPTERDSIDTVVRAGWQVMLVSADEDTDAPAFGYTIGLQHRVGHPELVISGLPITLMHSVLNYVAGQVMAGHHVRPGDGIEGALNHAPVYVESLSEHGLSEVPLWAHWFHRRRVEALALVWPTTSAIFGWQPGAPADLDARQPVAWRVPASRAGGFDVDPPWPLPVPADTLALVCDHVNEQGAPVCFVARKPDPDRGEGWTLHCGQEHPEGQSALVGEHISHRLRAAPSVRQIADLRLGEIAWRKDPFSPWRREMML